MHRPIVLLLLLTAMLGCAETDAEDTMGERLIGRHHDVVQHGELLEQADVLERARQTRGGEFVRDSGR
jgi:hypothetical protein